MDLTEIFGGPFDATRYKDEPKPQLSIAESYDDFMAAASAYGLIIDRVEEGRIVRCPVRDGGNRKKPGWYLFNVDLPTGCAFAVYGDWRDDQTQHWRSGTERLTLAEQVAMQARLDAARRQADAERKAKQDEAAALARVHIDSCSTAVGHAYLTRKKVKVHGKLFIDPNNGDLIIPIQNINNELRSYQRIPEDETKSKLFLEDGQTQGCFYFIGKEWTSPTYVVEGYATGATINELTGKSVVITFYSGNIKPVIKSIRAHFPMLPLIIGADNDRLHKDGIPKDPASKLPKERNTGALAAQDAAESFANVAYQLPEFPDGATGTDWNDLAETIGREHTKKQLLPEQSNIQYSNTTVYREPTPTDWVLDDFLVASTTALLFGPPGVAKSFLVQDMGMSIATGKPWHSREVKSGSVFYVAGEGHQDLGNRIHAWKTHHGYNIADQFPFYHTEHAINVRDPIWYQDLLNVTTGLEPPIQLIIIDTLSTNFGGGDENSGDMAAFISQCNALAVTTKACVLIVHHSGKDRDKGARGSSANHGDVYTYLPVDRVEHKGENLTRLTMGKQKGGPEIKPLAFKMTSIDLGEAVDARGRIRPISSLVPELALDANAEDNLIANIISTSIQKKGAAQRTLLAILSRYKEMVLTNKPDLDCITIERNMLNEELKNAGILRNNLARTIKSGIDQNWIKEVNGLVLEVTISD